MVKIVQIASIKKASYVAQGLCRSVAEREIKTMQVYKPGSVTCTRQAPVIYLRSPLPDYLIDLPAGLPVGGSELLPGLT